MTCRILVIVFSLAGAAVAQPPPSDPLTFDIKMPDTLPLRLQDPIGLRRPQLSFSGEISKVPELARRPLPPKPAAKPSPVGMPIVVPDPSVAHAMNVISPKPGVDYKIAVVPQAPAEAVAATAPEQP